MSKGSLTRSIAFEAGLDQPLPRMAVKVQFPDRMGEGKSFVNVLLENLDFPEKWLRFESLGISCRFTRW